MYKLLLILKYLRKRRIAWVSLVAVTLCTAMVLVIISVMGGWLRMFRSSYHSIAGDIIVDGRSMVGFPYYEEMLKEIRALPEVKAAAPVIRTFALVNIYGQIRKGVEVLGYPPNIGEVNGFLDSLYRKQGEKQLNFKLWDDVTYRLPGRSRSTEDPRSWPGIIVGSGVIGLKKDKNGEIHRDPIMYRAYVDMTVLPIDPDNALVTTVQPARQTFWIIDDSRTKVYIYDANSVYVPFDVLQKLLDMDGSNGLPARASDIQIALKPGVPLQAAREKIEQAVNRVAVRNNLDTLRYPYQVQTWEEVHATFIGAIEKEKGLVTILFGMISIVAVFLIFCIFYMIVVEKTRDIGIIKSVGATSAGVAGIFLGYGMAIGIVGGMLGLGVGWLVVRYINELHGWLGRLGVVIWNPEVYLFDTIPNTMNPPEVAVIVAVAIISSVLGALVPAIRAARMHPVEALRWE